jgi:hypothetical protein
MGIISATSGVLLMNAETAPGTSSRRMCACDSLRGLPSSLPT